MDQIFKANIIIKRPNELNQKLIMSYLTFKTFLT
jgi:hypothetical protein